MSVLIQQILSAFHSYLVVVLRAECHKRQHAQQKPCKSEQHLLSSVPNCPDNCAIEQKSVLGQVVATFGDSGMRQLFVQTPKLR
jgi:hypothetical protein